MNTGPDAQTTPATKPRGTTDSLITQISELLAPLGYELVHLEIVTSHHKILRLFIDRAPAVGATDRLTGGGVTLEDCVVVSKALDEPLEMIEEINRVFPAGYELEVSSPGIDRPLRTPSDYERFANQLVRIHTFRPLSTAEAGNEAYLAKNPKQKNFLGSLKGLRGEAVILDLSAGQPLPKAKKANSVVTKNSVEGTMLVTIPLPLISKANLEPQFETSSEERE